MSTSWTTTDRVYLAEAAKAPNWMGEVAHYAGQEIDRLTAVEKEWMACRELLTRWYAEWCAVPVGGDAGVLAIEFLNKLRTLYGIGKPASAEHERIADPRCVTASLAYPDMVSHLPTERCGLEVPHHILECGEIEEEPK